MRLPGCFFIIYIIGNFFIFIGKKTVLWMRSGEYVLICV